MQLGVHLLDESDGTLVVAVAEPLPPHLRAELSTAVGMPLRQVIAPRVRIQQAVAREHGTRLPDRAATVLRRLEGGGNVPPASRGLSVDFKSMPRPQSVPPLAFTGAALGAFDAGTAPPPDDYAELMRTERVDASSFVSETAEDAPARALPDVAPARGQRRGPYTAAMAEHDLLAAETRDDIAAAFFDFASQYFEYSAMFVIQGNEAVGRDARGAGSSAARVRSVRVPLDVPSALSKVRDDRTWLLGRLRAGGIEGGLAQDLDRPVGRKVLVLPISVRSRAVLVLYGDHGASDVELTAIGDVISFAPLVANALERAILEKKRGQRSATFSAPERRKAPHAAPSREQKARAFSELVEAEETRHSRPPPPPDAAALRMPSEPPLAPMANESRALGDRESPSAGFPALSSHTLPGFPSVTPGPEGVPGFKSRTPTAVVSVAPAPTYPTVSEASEAGAEDEPAFGPSETNTELGVGPRLVVTVATGNTPSAPAVNRKQTQRDLVPAPAQGAAPGRIGSMRPTAPSLAPPMAPSSHQESPTRPTVRPSAHPVALSETDRLVNQLIGGDENALRDLLTHGDAAIGSLIARFPGPVSVARRDPTTRASTCGPVLHALSRIGKPAVPYLTVRTADEDANVREWATRLLGELPSREAAEAIARRLVDDVVDVRRAALAAARMLQNHPEARDGALGQLEELSTDAALPPSVRRAAIEAITDLRQAQATPRMIELLDDADREVSNGARWSLMVLARQDYGTDRAAWNKFWEKNQSRHRIEWLIDSLTHPNRDIRRSAGDELKSVTREYFGYYDDLPEAERTRAQTRYREWWDTEGRRRFS
jgi:hypothetical protein